MSGSDLDGYFAANTSINFPTKSVLGAATSTLAAPAIAQDLRNQKLLRDGPTTCPGYVLPYGPAQTASLSCRVDASKPDDCRCDLEILAREFLVIGRDFETAMPRSIQPVLTSPNHAMRIALVLFAAPTRDYQSTISPSLWLYLHWSICILSYCRIGRLRCRKGQFGLNQIS